MREAALSPGPSPKREGSQRCAQDVPKSCPVAALVALALPS